MPGLANCYAAWFGILLGCVAGAVQGLWFHRPDWLGGYDSWARRMLRLGHISFFGIGLINLAFAVTAGAIGMKRIAWPSALLLTGAGGMPLVCYLAAYRQEFRHLFPVPALAVIGGIGSVLWRLMFP